MRETGGFVANALGLASCTLHFCKFDQMQKPCGCFFVQIGSMVQNIMAMDSPASKYLDFPVMQWGRLVKYKGFNKISYRIGVLADLI